MRIAILGGTGKEGSGLGRRWAAAGHQIIIGSRSAERATAAALTMSEVVPEASIEGCTNDDAARQCEIAVLAVPYEGQAGTLEEVGDALQGKLLLTVVAPLRSPKSRVWLPEAGSAAQEAQAQLGAGVAVVAGFQIISAEHLKELDHEIDSDVLVCGDRADDRQVAVDLAADAGMRGVHAGPLQNAAVAEGLAAVMIAINIRYGIKNAGMRITGLDAPTHPHRHPQSA